jgi:NADH-dependent formate dehydrogenase delta subunit FdsD/2Fe-2S thioredoxin-like protein
MRHMLHVCRAESCQAAGCESLVAHFENRLGIPIGHSTPDGSIALSPIYCLGNCAHSPAVLLDGKPYGCVTREIADSLIAEVRMIQNANQIALNFQNFPREEAIEGVRDHIERFWEPGLKEQLIAHVSRDGGSGLHDLVIEAVKRMPLPA